MRLRLFAVTFLGAKLVPWSSEYRVRKLDCISQALQNPALMEKFRQNAPLPAKYGLGFDERVIEFPWVLARVKGGNEHILDAGSALNHDFFHTYFQRSQEWKKKTLHIMTFSPEGRAFWRSGICYIYDDLRSIPMRDELYDTVICISTLEHIGFDNSFYTTSSDHSEHIKDDYLQVMNEFNRILKPEGRLLLTVPFGTYRDLGTCQIFDERLLNQALDAFGGIIEEKVFFRYNSDGWQLAKAKDCADADYVTWIMLPPAQRPSRFPLQSDGAAAARAVACVQLRKKSAS